MRIRTEKRINITNTSPCLDIIHHYVHNVRSDSKHGELTALTGIVYATHD